jgi:hypothetical protein
MNLVKLSELLEVSRSAITQSVRRLTKKNLVTFEFAQDNEKNKLFFSQVDINKKRENVLGDMHNGLVTLEEFTAILSELFDYAIVNWNSGNFYTIYASNNKDNLLDFLSKMTESLTPKRFVHHQLPVILFGLTKNEIKYRKIKEVEL